MNESPLLVKSLLLPLSFEVVAATFHQHLSIIQYTPISLPPLLPSSSFTASSSSFSFSLLFLYRLPFFLFLLFLHRLFFFLSLPFSSSSSTVPSSSPSLLLHLWNIGMYQCTMCWSIGTELDVPAWPVTDVDLVHYMTVLGLWCNI